MPYRRLPNTDAARLKAIQAALQKGLELPPFKLAYSQQSLMKLQSVANSFEQALQYHKQTTEQQTKDNRRFKENLGKARLYISHFIQVMNMAIQRGELPPQTRGYYELPKSTPSLPSLKTENDVIDIGKKLIEGEALRNREGHTCITNPTIAVVKVRYENFMDAFNSHLVLREKSKHTLEKVTMLRKLADETIQQIWNEVEKYYQDLPEEMKREKSANYGVAYVYRKNELQGIRMYEPVQKEIG